MCSGDRERMMGNKGWKTTDCYGARRRELTFGLTVHTGSQLLPRSNWRLRRATMDNTQTDVPSAKWLQAQLAFKNSMIRRILQFTPSITFRYVLHR